MIGPNVVAKTFKELYRQANPQEVQQGEAISDVRFDTQTYTSATTTSLTFFSAAQTDPTLSNMPIGGQFPDPQWFEIHNIGFDFLGAVATSAGNTAAGMAADIQLLMMVGRPIFTLVLSEKNYGQYPLSFLHTSGGAHGFGYGTLTAPNAVQVANNSLPDGGWNWRGSVVIPPKVGFSVRVQWSAAQTLTGGNPSLRFWMGGVLHRRVI